MFIKPQSKIKSNENGLYLVSTPIGNLKDITLRALEILKKSDIILCEDTRVSKKLLDKYAIKSKLISNHKFNEKKNVVNIIEFLKKEKIVSLISDAGTPVISDPGSVLVNHCVKNNIRIYPIPGPSAVSAAVSISGFSDQFFFYGFFPEKKQDIKREFDKLSKLNSTLVFFASTKKINKVINELKHYFAGRKIIFCREITKLYEEFVREDIDKLELFKKDQKGELTVVISEISKNKNISQKLDESDIIKIKNMINKFTIKEIISKIRVSKNISKKEIYNLCIGLKNEK
jgi:16S rRNA (cytidine1402-2'-O)-methyltransferase